MSTYYKILDKKLIGRQDSMFECYIYDAVHGWICDKDNILMDRIIGYDGETIGASSMIDMIEKITEEEALKIINK